MKICKRCERDLPLSEYGVDRARKDGLNLYCKSCIRDKKRIQTAKRKEYVLSTGIEAKPSDRVKNAIARGITDRAQIKQALGIGWDRLSDSIAELYDAGEIRFNREARCFEVAV